MQAYFFNLKMGKKSTLEITHGHLYDSDDELKDKNIPPQMIDRIKRIRSVVTRLDAYPLTSDKELRDALVKRYDVAYSTAYDDIRQAKAIVGNMHEASKSYHRYVFVEMISHAYKKAKLKESAKDMISAAKEYAKYMQLDKEDAFEYAFDEIVPQPFIPTINPEILGIKPIPNIDQKIAQMKKKYGEDVEYVNYEEIGIDPELLEYAKLNTENR